MPDRRALERHGGVRLRRSGIPSTRWRSPVLSSTRVSSTRQATVTCSPRLPPTTWSGWSGTSSDDTRKGVASPVWGRDYPSDTMPLPTNANLGAAIRRLRRARKLTIETLAFAAEMHPTYLSRIERGRRNPDLGQDHEPLTRARRALTALVQTAEEEAEVARAVRETRADHR